MNTLTKTLALATILIALPQLLHADPVLPAVDMLKVSNLAKAHFDAINELEVNRLAASVESVYTEDAKFIDPFFVVVGRAKIVDAYKSLHEKFPGSHFERVGEIVEHHDYARFHWQLIGAGSKKPLHTGDDFVKVESGKIAEIIVMINN